MIKLMRTQQSEPLFQAIISSVFRRFGRLFGSAAIASFIQMNLVAFGWSSPERLKLNQKSSYLAQLWDWLMDFVRYSNIFAANVQTYWDNRSLNNKYIPPLWTIPVEYRGSIIVFAFGITSCKLSTRNRMLLCSSLVVLCYIWTIVYVALFLGGFLLADLSFTRSPERLYPLATLPQRTQTAKPKMSWQKKVLFSVICAFSVLLVSLPLRPLHLAWQPWPLLESMIPSQYKSPTPLHQHFWTGIGGMLLVYSLDCYPTLQIPLRWNFSRYLGEVSFGLYVMHFPIVWLFNDRMLSPIRVAYFGNAFWPKIPVVIVVYGLVLWAADLFTRLDNKVVASSKWLQDRFFVW